MTTPRGETFRLQVAPKMRPFVNSPYRYDIAHGGRGSTKSWTFGDITLARAAGERIKILCCREVQNSIRDSVHALLKTQIYRLGLEHRFRILQESIYSHAGAEFLFKGLRGNKMEIKSIEDIDICWVEEAAKVTRESWNYLVPTIRKPGSKIMVSFNPEEEKDETYQRFVIHPPPNSLVVEVNYWDNPWFYDTELPAEMEYDKKTDFEKYEHVWCGKPKRYAAALIFKGKYRVESFETPKDARFLFGADFGFSVDPTCLVRMFIKNRKLFIDYEAYGHGIELDDMHQFFEAVPESHKWEIRADSARPETISFLARPFLGKDRITRPPFHIVGAEKGEGSVEDGIQFLRGFEEVVIHPRCKGTASDFGNYKWKTDRITQEILPVPAPGSDHAPDAARYALERYMKSKATIWDILR